MNHVVIVHFQRPLGQEIENRHNPRHMGSEIGPYTMVHLLAVADGGEHRQHRFHHHPRVPGPARTDFPVGGLPGFGLKSCICEDDHGVVKLGNQGLKVRIVDVRRGAVSGTDQAPLVHDKTQLAADNPAMIAFALLANLRGAPPFAHWMDKLNALGVRHP